ncbi:MAG: alpha-galactosidase [Dehalococcoidia bacterium]|nr:alpha-galactosidase [Dehalococcoidia bacterium]
MIRPDEVTDIGTDTAPIPFSFVYDGRQSGDLLGTWDATTAARGLDHFRTERVCTFTDPATGLEVRCEAIAYQDSPAIEWVLHLTNTGDKDTPIIEDILPLDMAVDNASDSVILHHSRGSLAIDTDFMPVQDVLGKGAKKELGTSGGRSSQDSLPWYNVEFDGQGIIVAIGWTGQWAATIEHNEEEGCRLAAGMELTHLKLRPGESIRTPSIVMQHWEDADWLEGQNAWRRFILAYHHPQQNGEPAVPPIFCGGSWIFAESTISTPERVITLAEKFREHGIETECFWMDAGWYSIRGPGNINSELGTWKADPKRFPEGLGPVGDAFRDMGLGYLVWFEPERVDADSVAARERPDFVWGGADGGLFKLGDPEARQWLTDYLVDFINESGITIYRQDFNMDPLRFWRDNDAPDRQGMNEIRHIEGLYQFWDDLVERIPGLLIDNCSSGGRRLDIEMVSRSMAFWRTDGWDSESGLQTMLNLYFPGHSGGWAYDDPYKSRAKLAAGVYFVLFWDIETWEPKFDPTKIRWLLDEFRQLRPLFYGDFYPLITPTNDATDWVAYQVHRSDLERGAVVALRRPGSPYQTADVALRQIDSDATYRVAYRDLEAPDPVMAKTVQGGDLADLDITIEHTRRSLVITYEKAK